MNSSTPQPASTAQLELPQLHNTDDAMAYGREIRDASQFVYLMGARAALQRESDRIRPLALFQLLADLAFEIQMISEALEETPFSTLVVLPHSDICENPCSSVAKFPEAES